MSWKARIRQAHRWLGVVFTATVVLDFALLAVLGQPPAWTFYLPLPPLFLLMFSGLSMLGPFGRRPRPGA